MKETAVYCCGKDFSLPLSVAVAKASATACRQAFHCEMTS